MLRDVHELSVVEKSLLLLSVGWVLLVFIALSADLQDTVLSNPQSLYYALSWVLMPAVAIGYAVDPAFRRQREGPALRPASCLFPLLCVFLC